MMPLIALLLAAHAPVASGAPASPSSAPAPAPTPSPTATNATPLSPMMTPTTAPQVMAQVNAHKGKVVVVNFWASFCLPCLTELPVMVGLQQELKNDVVFVFVSFDDAADEAHARTILRRRKITLVSGLHQGTADDWLKQFPQWTGSVPHTIVFGRDGAQLLEIDGEIDPEIFAAQVRALGGARRQP
jgi:thiol-disulfide isomerase/thioredoxin